MDDVGNNIDWDWMAERVAEFDRQKERDDRADNAKSRGRRQHKGHFWQFAYQKGDRWNRGHALLYCKYCPAWTVASYGQLGPCPEIATTNEVDADWLARVTPAGA